jgi:hypothetical protein
LGILRESHRPSIKCIALDKREKIMAEFTSAKAEGRINPEVTFKYIFTKEYNAKYASGVYGGVTANGEIVANFFFERHALPISQTNAIEQSGQLGKLIRNEPEDLQKLMVRVVENGVILNTRSARTIVDWLTSQIEQAEKTIASQKAIDK